jgi:hypothetical protein
VEVEKQQGAIKFNCTLLFRLIAPLYFAVCQLLKSISAIGAIKIRKKTPGGGIFSSTCDISAGW